MNEITKENKNIVYETHEEMVAGLAPAINRTIKKIGIDKYHNTCRLILDDDTVLFVQSVKDENLFLKHGVVASIVTEKGKFVDGKTMTWANDLSSATVAASEDLRDSANNQAALRAETEKAATVGSSALVRFRKFWRSIGEWFRDKLECTNAGPHFRG